jgi:predicted DNA-binding transcriptional regulator
MIIYVYQYIISSAKAMTIRRLEEDQGVEHRLVLNRVAWL